MFLIYIMHTVTGIFETYAVARCYHNAATPSMLPSPYTSSTGCCRRRCCLYPSTSSSTSANRLLLITNQLFVLFLPGLFPVPTASPAPS